MLDESKDEILSYATKNGLEYREDSTNFERDATRNCLRLDVFPALETAIPGAKENLLAFGALAKEDDEYLYKLASELVSVVEPQNEADTGKCVKIAPPPLFRRACLMVLKEIGLEKDYTKKHLQAIVGLCEAQTGTKIVLPMGITAVRAYDQVKFFVGDVSSGRLPEYPFGFGEFEWGRYALNVSKETLGRGVSGGLPLAENGKLLRVDVDQVPAGSIIRTRKEGDCFRPFGGGKKSLKKYLIDRKIPLALRDQLPLVAMGNVVLAIFGVEIGDSLKITKETKNTAYLAVQTKLTEDK
jgi:tRNA(Ile)-lysidine synthase